MGHSHRSSLEYDSAYGSPVSYYNHHQQLGSMPSFNTIILPRLDCINFAVQKPVSAWSHIGRFCLLTSVRMVPLLYLTEISFFVLLFTMVKMHNNVELESYMPAIYSGILAVSLVLSLVLFGIDYRCARRTVISSSIEEAVSNRLAYYYFSVNCTKRYAFLSAIRNPFDKAFDALTFFVYFRLKEWKHIIVQVPRQWGYMLFVWWFIMVGNPLRRTRDSDAQSGPNSAIAPNLLPALPDMLRSNSLPQAMFIMAMLMITIWIMQVACLVISILAYPVLLAFLPLPSLDQYCTETIQERCESLLIDMDADACTVNPIRL
ncbi:hypothetical protein BSLG_001362 [Batrachochytrium salamandrivorans]|nr:hypothetical protein BSLG_001362 [Batrachochytrium salamandrivorans]